MSIYKAVSIGHLDCLKRCVGKYLWEYDDPFEHCESHYELGDLAIRNKKLDILKYLVKKGLKITHNNCKHINGSAKYEYIHTACHPYYASPDIIQYLIDMGCSVNKIAYGGYTPFGSLMLNGHIDLERLDPCINILIRNGADVNIHNIRGCSPIACSLELHKPQLCAKLITYGCRLKEYDVKELKEHVGRDWIVNYVMKEKDKIIKILLDVLPLPTCGGHIALFRNIGDYLFISCSFGK
jgi:hypothetical protein